MRITRGAHVAELNPAQGITAVQPSRVAIVASLGATQPRVTAKVDEARCPQLFECGLIRQERVHGDELGVRISWYAAGARRRRQCEGYLLEAAIRGGRNFLWSAPCRDSRGQRFGNSFRPLATFKQLGARDEHRTDERHEKCNKRRWSPASLS